MAVPGRVRCLWMALLRVLSFNMGNYYNIDPVVVIGVPTLLEQPLSWHWSDAFYSISFPLGSSHARFRIHDEIVGEARNQIAQQALSINADWVLFLSDDVVPPPEVFSLLVRHKKPLVTGVYWEKKPACRQPYIWRDVMKGPFTEWKYGEFFKVDWAGCDCLLVHTDVFRAIEYPYFSHDWRWTGASDKPATLATEDMYFYTKTRKAGFDLWCDASCQCLHQDRNSLNLYGLDTSMPQHINFKAIKPEQKNKMYIADIGAGAFSPHFSNAVVKRFDGDPVTEPDIVCDVRAIPEKTESFDMVYSSHVLEHFFYYEVRDVLTEWIRILKVGGEIKILVPNLEHAAHEILKACNNERYDASYAHGMLYGTRDIGENPVSSFPMKADSHDSTQIHKMGFIKHGLRRLLELFKCLDNVKVEAEGFDGEASLTATARKIKSSKPEILLDTWNEVIAPKEGVKLNCNDVGSHSIEDDVKDVQSDNATQTRKRKDKPGSKVSNKPKAK